MNKNNEIYGVAISKGVFDVANSKGNHFQYKNNGSGFKCFLKTLSEEDLVVMEATGYYHYRLSQFLYEQGIKVSVVNPFISEAFYPDEALQGENG